jgi:GNAT superfamily N-acetyltransferase
VVIERGSLRDYAAFAGMHYRQGGNLGFVDRVFVMRERAGGEAVGVVVYGFAAMELALRNRVTGGRWIRSAERLNRELRVLKRLVIHPDLRGCGLGHRLVRETLPLAGTAFVECLAALGAVHPVFEKAGMTVVGACRAPGEHAVAMRELQALGADAFAADFLSQVSRRPNVRRIVTQCVAGWYRATTGGGERRAGRQTPSVLARTFRQIAGSRPVYYIWARDAEGREVIERGMLQQDGEEKVTVDARR